MVVHCNLAGFGRVCALPQAGVLTGETFVFVCADMTACGLCTAIGRVSKSFRALPLAGVDVLCALPRAGLNVTG